MIKKNSKSMITLIMFLALLLISIGIPTGAACDIGAFEGIQYPFFIPLVVN